MLKAAVIGVGWMGLNHVGVYGELEDVHVAAVADVNVEAARAIAARYQVKASYSDYCRMLDEVELDIVSIAVPTELHRDVALQALERGIHVLIEKPIAATSAEGGEIVRKAQEKGLTIAVGHTERFNPAVLELKRRLDAGELGQVFQMRARRLTPSPGRILDVGVVLDIATHDLDIVRYLSAAPVRRVFAEITRAMHEPHEDL